VITKFRKQEKRMKQQGVSQLEKHVRVKDVSRTYGVSPRTVRRMFEGRTGLKIIGDPVGTNRKRRYRIMLIPESLVKAVFGELEVS
jgi:AraC-like DNA-binding protein